MVPQFSGNWEGGFQNGNARHANHPPENYENLPGGRSRSSRAGAWSEFVLALVARDDTGPDLPVAIVPESAALIHRADPHRAQAVRRLRRTFRAPSTRLNPISVAAVGSGTATASRRTGTLKIPAKLNWL